MNRVIMKSQLEYEMFLFIDLKKQRHNCTLNIIKLIFGYVYTKLAMNKENNYYTK